MTDYSSLFEAAGKAHNVDPALLRAVMYRGEMSNGDPGAVSPKGATGLMQLMPSTAKDMGVTDINDPVQNIHGGAKYLSQLLDKYGTVPLALAAYNAGPGAVDKAGGIPNFPETQAYVRRTMNTYQGQNMPQKSQAQAEPTDPLRVLIANGGGGAQQSAAGTQDDPLRALIATGGGAKEATPASSTDPLRSLIEQGTSGVSPQSATPAPQPTQEPGVLESIAASAGKGFGKTMLGAQQLVGEGLKKLGGLGQSPQNMVYRSGQWLVNDATQGAANLDAQAAPYAGAHPVASAAGEVTGALVNPLNRLVPMGKGNTLLQLMGKGAAQGAVSGALTPVQEGDNFWSDKAKQTALGGAIGGATPGAVAGIAAGTKYAGNALRSLIDPFTDAGQTRIAGNLLYRFGAGGPLTGNAAEIVPGSVPTLAQATGNPGLATLERGIQGATPQGAIAFSERAANNAQARGAAFQNAAGTAADLSSAKLERAANAADDYLKTQVGIPVANTEYAALKQTPAFQQAFARAQRMAKNAGTTVETTTQNRANANLGGAIGQPETYVSGQGLQTIKEALDDQINAAARAGNNKQAANIIGVKDRLVSMMDNAIPGYAAARAAYAEASRPIDAMKYLQGLNITDAQGNITLAKVQNALNNLGKARGMGGVNDAKSVTQAQIDTLTSIRDDLLRASNSSAGKAIGSNTFQNLATNNILENALPGPVRTIMGGTSGPVGNLLSRAGNLVYGGANENIQNKLLDMMLQPQSGLAALNNVRGNAFSGQPRNNALLERLAPYLVPAGAIGGVNMIPAGK